MTVIDASVAVKWFLEEAGSAGAKQTLLHLAGAIVVPDMFLVEVVGALVRQANVRKAERRSMEGHVSRLAHLFEVESIRAVRLDLQQTARAAHLALDLGHPLKDCVYLALARDLDCPLVTADARFAGKARGVHRDVRLL